MAAGGFKEFVAGETLDEDEINDFLMQGMLVFAGTAARGSAITAPVEGQFSFLKDSDSVEFFDGSQWTALESGSKEFEFVVVAGGGGGATGRVASFNEHGGAGGAGGYFSSVVGELSGGSVTALPKLLLNTDDVFTVKIGAGGAGATGAGILPGAGASTICANIIPAGGGRGPREQNGVYGEPPGSGGSSAGCQPFFSATTPAFDFQGFAGGTGNAGAGGGGGGASQVGGNAPSTGIGGDGGDGISSSITGSAVSRAGGGGGGGQSSGGSGGAGGGGNGGTGASTAATSGAANTGGGGGSCDPRAGSAGSGGSGVVILKYADNITLTIGAGLTSSTTTSGGFKVTTFTAGTDTVTVA